MGSVASPEEHWSTARPVASQEELLQTHGLWQTDPRCHAVRLLPSCQSVSRSISHSFVSQVPVLYQYTSLIFLSPENKRIPLDEPAVSLRLEARAAAKIKVKVKAKAKVEVI